MCTQLFLFTRRVYKSLRSLLSPKYITNERLVFSIALGNVAARGGKLRMK